MYLLSELWFAFLDCGHHHVTHTSSRKSVQSSLDPLHGDDIQIFGSCVVRTIDHSSYRKTQGNPEFRTRGPGRGRRWGPNRRFRRFGCGASREGNGVSGPCDRCTRSCDAAQRRRQGAAQPPAHSFEGAPLGCAGLHSVRPLASHLRLAPLLTVSAHPLLRGADPGCSPPAPSLAL